MAATQPLCHIITPVGCLGYGLDSEPNDIELHRLRLQNDGAPIAIILDAGSTDSGPARLGLGTTAAPRSAYVRDLTKVLGLCEKYQVPLLFSSAGGDGSTEHVGLLVEVIKEILQSSEKQYKTNIVSIKADVPKPLVQDRLASGNIRGCGPSVPTLTESDITDATTIVAQIGVEPFLDAMFSNPDFNIIVGGRAYDPSPFVAFASYTLMNNASQRCPVENISKEILGGFFHVGKIMECGAQCATPKSRAARATIYQDGTFDVCPLENGVKCTPLAVAAHTLYEKTRPDLLMGPGGCLDLSQTTYEALEDDKTVRCRGATFAAIKLSGNPYNVKLEGAKVAGYRTMFVGAFRDPTLTVQLDDFFAIIRAYVAQQHETVKEKWSLHFHTFGATSKTDPGEVCVVGEVLAETQATANSVSTAARVACIHGPYAGQKATSGNLAFGISGKTDIECGPCAQFCVYHLMDLKEGEEGAKHIGDQQGAALFRWERIVAGIKDMPIKTTWADIPAIEVPANDSAQAFKALLAKTATAVSKNGHSKPATTLGEVAKVIRSKNSGPYEVTFDLLFETEHEYRIIKDSGMLTQAIIARMFEVEETDVIWCGFFDQARAYKATIPRMNGGRKSVSGGFGDEDVHGSQKYLPLARLALPVGVQQKLGN